VEMLTAVAYVNLGYWVADCPRPFCTGAEHFGGRVNGLGMAELGGLTDAGFTCKACGLQCPAQWPASDHRVEVERILMERPNPRNRNWLPGETVFTLLAENIAHGIYPPASIEAMNTPIDKSRREAFRVEDLTDGDVTALLRQPARALMGGA
jgi:hypothetical protein